jgi:hypothetical protein
MPSHRLFLCMARRYMRILSVTVEQGRHNIKLGLRNGRIAPPACDNGTSVWQPCQKRTALFSDDSPIVSWVERLASKHSRIAAHLIQALALRLKINKCYSLMPFHISGSKNAMTDIPSQSFGSVSQWYYKNESDLLTFFNLTFPLPNQQLWTVFCPSYKIGMHVISVLWMRHSILADWR